MKLTDFLIFAGLYLFVSQGALAGVDSSGGGVGMEPFRMTPGSVQGTLRMELATSANGSLATVLKYFKLAGALKKDQPEGSVYTLNQAKIFESKSPQGEQNSMHFQMNLLLNLPELQRLSSVGAETRLAFGGPLAAALYESMEKNGAKLLARNKDNQGNVVGFLFGEGRALNCEKHSQNLPHGNITCWIAVSTEVTKPVNNCAECGG